MRVKDRYSYLIKSFLIPCKGRFSEKPRQSVGKHGGFSDPLTIHGSCQSEVRTNNWIEFKFKDQLTLRLGRNCRGPGRPQLATPLIYNQRFYKYNEFPSSFEEEKGEPWLER